MKVYNGQKIVDLPQTIMIDGAEMYTKHMSEEQLNIAGYYYIEYQNIPNRRYYTYTESGALVGNKFVVSYTPVDNNISVVYQYMLKDLKDAFLKYAERPRVDTGLGFFVDGGRADKDNFKELWDSMLSTDTATIKDADNNFQLNISKADMETIWRSIVSHAQGLYAIKWQKEQEIAALATVADCELYENTPYDYTVTQADVDLDPTLTLGQIITKYKNNVKEW